MVTRIASGIIFALLLLTAPWWLTFSAGLIFLLRYPYFWELVAGGLFIDLTFGTPISSLYGYTFVLTTATLAAYIARQVVARRIFIRI